MPQGKHNINILEPLSIIQSPKVYGWPKSHHFTEFLKDFPYNMAPTSKPKGGSTSKVKFFYLCILLIRTMSFDDFCMKKTTLKV